MPHCIIEYAQQLEEIITPHELIQAVTTGARTSGLFNDNDIKTRCRSYQLYQTGLTETPFIHVNIKILSGRSVQQRKHLSSYVLNELKKLELKPVSLTIEVNDMEKESYSKLEKNA
ncbi:MAG: 5-carboxymethyl-2-hydroxymuconate Delta-isomerase [Arenicella sp.]